MKGKITIVNICVVALFCVNLILIYQILFGSKGFFYYKKLKDQKQQLELKLKDIQNQNIQLSKEVNLIKHSREYQEYVIRKILHMGRKNEVLYIISNAN